MHICNSKSTGLPNVIESTSWLHVFWVIPCSSNIDTYIYYTFFFPGYDMQIVLGVGWWMQYPKQLVAPLTSLHPFIYLILSNLFCLANPIRTFRRLLLTFAFDKVVLNANVIPTDVSKNGYPVGYTLANEFWPFTRIASLRHNTSFH